MQTRKSGLARTAQGPFFLCTERRGRFSILGTEARGSAAELVRVFRVELRQLCKIAANGMIRPKGACGIIEFDGLFHMVVMVQLIGTWRLVDEGGQLGHHVIRVINTVVRTRFSVE